jgi:hypothetical protein
MRAQDLPIKRVPRTHTTTQRAEARVPAHLAFPIRLGAGGLATVEQDSDADIVQSVALLLDTRPGERRSVPEYGLPDPLFSGLTEDQVTAVISEWEERADVDLLHIDNLTSPPTRVGYGGGYYGRGYYGGKR